MLLHRIKKFAFIIGVMTVIVIALSLPAFAADVDFTLSSYPMHTLTNNNYYQSYSYFFKALSGDYYYVEVQSYSEYARFSGDIDLTACSFYRTDSGKYLFLPVIYNHRVGASGSWSHPTKFYVYNTSGQLVHTFNSSISLLWENNTAFVCSDIGDNGVTLFNFLLMARETDYVCDVSTSTYQGANDFIIQNTPDVKYNGSVSFGGASFVWTYQNALDPDFPNQSSIEDSIYVNQTLVYEPSGGGGGDNIAINIVSQGVGSLTPEYDQQGNISGYTFNITTEADYSPIFNYQPDGATVPDLNIDDPNDDMFPEASFDSDDLNDLGIMSGGSALTWFYARFNDLATGNVKVLSLITSCLSLGFIMLILNKRSI